MKKKKIIIITALVAFLIGILLASGIAVYASINSNTVSYTKAGSSTAMRLDAALDELYTRTTKIVDLGTGTSFNVSSYDGYENFTESNFIIEVNAFSGSFTRTGPWSLTINSINSKPTLSKTKSYNNSTGVLSASYVLSEPGTITHSTTASLNLNNYNTQSSGVHAFLIY